MAQPSQRKEGYRIGIICALALEKAAMIAMLDESHPRLEREDGDNNDYTLGRIGVHKVVIACLPAGSMGNGPAATVAKNMQRSFPIKIGLMVGVGGGVWSKKTDVRLGDVVISQPTGTHGGVVQWDFGKMGKGGIFQRTGSLNKPPPVLLHSLQTFKTQEITDGINVEECLALMVRNKPRMSKEYRYQGVEHDQLFEATYDHKGDETCESCEATFIVQRTVRDDSTPRIHYGNIASGNEVMKHGTMRDEIAKKEDVICFEMEAAGLMDEFQCIVIRGICDYADSHKNKTWQPYAAATAAAVARELLGFIDEQEVIQTPHSFKPHRVLPFGRNRVFVGRQSYLDRLIKILHTEDTGDSLQRVALTGLGGVGKTQIALEFAFRIQDVSPKSSVFWVRANDATSFENAYREIGQELKIPGLDDDKADLKDMVKKRLSKEGTGKWVMIVDNADNFELLYNRIDESSDSQTLHEYLPFSFSGAILFTTRDHEAATRYAGPNVITIEEMDDSESRELLGKSLQNQRLVEDEGGIAKLLRLLVNLPLATTQAVAYINAKQITIAEYLDIYEESGDNVIELLSKDFTDERRYPGMKNPIVTTWLISFEQVRLRSYLAADYMAFISCINEQAIPKDLLPSASRLDKTEAISTLKAFEFIKERGTGGSYDMHRLVHIAMRSWLNLKGELTLWKVKTLERIADAFPWPERDNKALWTMYLPHAQSILTLTKDSEELEERHWKMFHNVGQCLYITGKYAESEQIYRQVLERQEKALGIEHPSTLDIVNNLALVLQNQGKYETAEEMHRRALEGKEKILGIEHFSTLQSVNNLALLLRDQRNYEMAEKMHRRALEGKEKTLGTEHLSTLNSVNNLALVLQHQEKYETAEKMHRRALEGKEKTLGIEHSSTLDSVDNLGLVLQYQGKYETAEEMHRRALEGYEKLLGIEHPDTLHSVNNLAGALQYQGKYETAEKMHRRALEGKEKILGIEHRFTLNSVENLGLVLQHQGKYETAEEMHRRALEGYEKWLGIEHPDTLDSVNNLAVALQYQGKYEMAEKMYRRGLEEKERALGTEHLSTLNSVNNLALALQDQGKYETAEKMHRRALEGYEKVLGVEHPRTLASIENLAEVIRHRENYGGRELAM